MGRCRWILLVGLVLGIFLSSCQGSSSNSHGAHEHEHEHEEEVSRGPHGGRILEDGNVSVELSVFEKGVPPRYRVYVRSSGKPVAPDSYHALVQLTRLGKEEESIHFHPVAEFQESSEVIEEPHSFDVKVRVQYKDKDHNWSFSSYEGRTTIPQAVAEKSGIVTELAGPRRIKETLPVRGKILPSEHRIAHIIPRFSGVVREGRKHIGDRVERGEVLAVIESNQSLQPFEVRSQIAGTIINGHLIVGEFVPENQWVFVVADLSEVWADFYIPLSQRARLRLGQFVEVPVGDQGEQVTGVVSYIAPYADERSQSQMVRVVLPNGEGRFVPGMFITGNLVASEVEVPVAVKESALQTFRDWDVVFLQVGDVYEGSPVTLGRSDGEWREVVSGLVDGERYVSRNSFVVKADILKAGAAHDH
jgi:cobalt-zinc-cadmium efflux system membrane fusion protein